MLLYDVRPKNNQGFTMIETLVIVIIIGILSTIAGPSFLDLFQKSDKNDAASQVRGALQECQREAISKSQVLTLEITDYKVSGSCLVTGERDLCDERDNSNNCVKSRVAMVNNIGTSMQIKFGIRGNTTIVGDPTPTYGKIVLYNPDNSNPEMKCVAISNVIGIITSGKYSGSINSAANIESGSCTAEF